MNQEQIITELQRNKNVFASLLNDVGKDCHIWKVSANKWCLLEVICHLYDEELEDFRARVKHALEHPELPVSPIDPQGWVESRDYIGQNFDDKLSAFLDERENSIVWLKSLESPKWEHCFDHPQLGKMSASQTLSNWLAHDYIHIRQINRIKYEYLDEFTNDSLTYAGDW